ncbi:SART-1 family protein [Fragilaria crotonensis]|nr:SART-1 family protein [Fragilaria crotonensis]
MSDVIELSIAETNELRAKLGLKPLKLSSTQSQSQSQSQSVEHNDESNSHNMEASTPQNGTISSPLSSSQKDSSELSLSVQETNKLRVSLGLKPLNTNKEAVHLPADNEGAKKELEERIEKERLKRQVQQGIASSFGTQTLGDVTTTKDTSGSAVLSWASKMRTGSGVDDNAVAISGKNKKPKKAKKVKPTKGVSQTYDEAHLEGINVGHATSDFEAGSTTILTLADAPLLVRANDSRKVIGLNDDPETARLENVQLADDQAQQHRLRQKRQVEMGMGRAGGYAGYDDDEFEELGGVQAPMRLERGTAPMAGNIDNEQTKRRGFKLGQAMVQEEDSASTGLFAHEKGKAISLEHSVASVVASDFMTAEEYAASLPNKKKKEMKFKKKKTKKDKKNKRTVEIDDDDDEDLERAQPMGSILDELEQTAIKSNKKRKRRDDGNGDDNNDEETDSHLLHADDIADAAKRRARFDEIMEKGNVQSEAAFKPLIKEETKAANTLDDEVEPDDNFLNEALAKARRLRKLRELSTPRGADAVAQAVLDSNAASNNSEAPTNESGIDFTVDETLEFTRVLRAREDLDERRRTKKQAKSGQVIIDSSQGVDEKADHVMEDTEGADMSELAKQIKEDEQEPIGIGIDGTATTSTVGRGMAGVLAMLRHTGEISGRNAGREELRGRAKDERTYEDYAPLNLKEVVRIGKGATDKDRELASREIKLDYRDEHGRLLTRKEAYRNLCYQFHGHGSSAKNEERRLRQIEREQSGTARIAAGIRRRFLGALKATQRQQERHLLFIKFKVMTMVAPSLYMSRIERRPVLRHIDHRACLADRRWRQLQIGEVHYRWLHWWWEENRTVTHK